MPSARHETQEIHSNELRICVQKEDWNYSLAFRSLCDLGRTLDLSGLLYSVRRKEQDGHVSKFLLRIDRDRETEFPGSQKELLDLTLNKEKTNQRLF